MLCFSNPPSGDITRAEKTSFPGVECKIRFNGNGIGYIQDQGATHKPMEPYRNNNGTNFLKKTLAKLSAYANSIS